MYCNNITHDRSTVHRQVIWCHSLPVEFPCRLMIGHILNIIQGRITVHTRLADCIKVLKLDIAAKHRSVPACVSLYSYQNSWSLFLHSLLVAHCQYTSTYRLKCCSVIKTPIQALQFIGTISSSIKWFQFLFCRFRTSTILNCSW